MASAIIEKFVPEVYQDQVMQCPTLPEDWLLVESELSTCRGWKAYSNQMSTRWRQPLLKLQGLPLHCILGPGGWRLQVPVGGHGDSRVNFRCSEFQAHRFEAQIEDGSIGFPDSESLEIG